MQRNLPAWIGLTLLALVAWTHARAEDPPAPPAQAKPQPKRLKVARKTTPARARDPFGTPPSLRDPTTGAAPIAAKGGERAARLALPDLRVQGVLVVAGRPPGVLLRVGARAQVVRAGDRLSVRGEEQSVTLRVTRISPLGRVELTLPGGRRVEVGP